ncbi:MAG TPA: glycosyltransferase [Armatimonadota bacterium]|nr:glycosyltransferase [Armatimonadota bacterium]
MSDPFLTVVVPCYNESRNLRRGVLQEMHVYLSAQDHAYEVLISDDGSTDDSREIVREQIADLPGFRLLENAHGGKPMAVWNGIRAGRGEIILFTDMDQSTPIDQVAPLLARFAEGYDVVIGSRGLTRKDFPLYRRLGSAAFAGLRRLMLLRGVNDTQCGFKALRAAVAREVFPQLSEMRRQGGTVRGHRVTAFDVELLYLAERAGHRIAEVTVAWANRDVAKGSLRRYARESVEMASQIVRIKMKERRGEYGEARGA